MKHVNRKWAFFSFNKPWRHHICIAKCLNSYRDNFPKKLFKITAQECKKSTSGWRASLLLKHPINMVYMLTWWGGHGDLRYCGIELLLFQVDFDNFSIFLTVLRYYEPLMSPSMMEGLILELFCLRKSCAVDLSERVSGVAHLCKSFHTRCNFPVKWVVYHLEFFPDNQVKNQKWNTTLWEQRNIFKSSPGCLFTI